MPRQVSNDRHSRLLCVLLAAGIALGPVAAAQAYVGPGAGLSLLGALWGVLVAIGGALAFVVMWPIRRLRRRRREAARAEDTGQRKTPSAGNPRDHDTPER